MDLLGVGNKAEIEFLLDPVGERKNVDVKIDNQSKHVAQSLYYHGEDVTGTVVIKLKKNGKLEHQGIRLEFIGQIEMVNDRSATFEFTNVSKSLALPGEITERQILKFEFPEVPKPYETYHGINVRVRYFLRVTVIRRLFNIVNERDVCVHQILPYPQQNAGIKMEVGIEDCLHIEFEYSKSKYHLKDVIVGKIYFLLVRIKIKHMEIAILKKEITGSGASAHTESETIAKYEIMDGGPVKGENIPIRLFLGGYELTPTMKDVQRKFSVRYYLNLILFDEEDRRYFKQQEIILWRKHDKDQEKNSAEQYIQYAGKSETSNEKDQKQPSAEKEQSPSDEEDPPSD